MPSIPLPVEEVLPELLHALRIHHNVILSAPPGAGKTTRVPLAILESDLLHEGKIVMLEPRRLAARRAAEYMAARLGETPGGRVGYRIRGESRPGSGVEVVTEGVLARMMSADPGLTGIAMVIFDEFHERSIHADLGLALALEVQTHMREDLRILVMSATLDSAAIHRALGDVPEVVSQGQSHPVETKYVPPHHMSFELVVVAAIHRALKECAGDILVFLPGQREIRRVERLLNDGRSEGDAEVHLLYSEASREAQQAALAAAQRGKRKIILSTSIAETSLTIDGVRVVIDAGVSRVSRFDTRRGMAGLETIPVSRASADQRRGRAGRQAPGVCYRLWSEEREKELAPYAVPEILATDLAPLALEIAAWGGGEGLRFIDPPPEANLRQARGLLRQLGALDAEGRLTGHGEEMRRFPVHPRLAHMILRAQERGSVREACLIAALLEEGDIFRGSRSADVDIESRLHELQKPSQEKRNDYARILRESRRLLALAGDSATAPREGDAGALMALAYPDRIGRRKGEGRYLTSAGTGALLPSWSLMAREEFLAIAEVDAGEVEARIFLAAPVRGEDLHELFADQIAVEDLVFWDGAQQAVIAVLRVRLGSITIEERAREADPEAVRSALVDGVRSMGISCLPWTPGAREFQLRCEWIRLHGIGGEGWPALDDSSLAASMEVWLAPFLDKMNRREHLARLDIETILVGQLHHRQRQLLDRQAPTTIVVPSGSRVRVTYDGASSPVVSVKLQEMFGQEDTPLIGGVKAVVHLLSPAGRLLAVTQDLQSFWKNIYPEVRKEMRGRYPKHPWPEDPLSAIPTRRTKPRK
jgi:ATP-dependent helicase HrpB